MKRKRSNQIPNFTSIQKLSVKAIFVEVYILTLIQTFNIVRTNHAEDLFLLKYFFESEKQEKFKIL